MKKRYEFDLLKIQAQIFLDPSIKDINSLVPLTWFFMLVLFRDAEDVFWISSPRNREIRIKEQKDKRG